MTEPSDRAKRALRRANRREHVVARSDDLKVKNRMNDPENSKAVAQPYSTSTGTAAAIGFPPVASSSSSATDELKATTTTTTSNTTTSTEAATLHPPPIASSNDRKRPARLSIDDSLTTASGAPAPDPQASLSTKTHNKKHRSEVPQPPPPPPPPPPPQQPSLAAAKGDDDDDDTSDNTGNAEKALAAYRIKSASAAAATVTPAVPRRHIHFGAKNNSKKEQQQQQLLPTAPESSDASVSPLAAETTTTTTTTTTNAPKLPVGVVDIYPPREWSGQCTCVAEISLEQRAGFLHTANYGQDWQQYLREKEIREYPNAAAKLSPLTTTKAKSTGGAASSASSSLLCTSPVKRTGIRDSSSQQQANNDSPESTDSSKSHLSSSTSSSSSLNKEEAPSTTLSSLLRFDVRGTKDTPRFLEEQTQHLKRQPYITPRMRAVLVSWLIEVSSEYDISDQALHLAITLLDLMLSKGPADMAAWEKSCHRRRRRQQRLAPFRHDDDDSSSIDPENDDGDENEDSTVEDCFVIQRGSFQALGCACAWIASKMEDKKPPLQDDFVYISDQSVSSGMLLHLEKRICKELDFKLHRLTPLHYANSFLRASNACPCLTCPFDHPILRQLVLYLLELARIPVSLVDCPPSLVAAAAVYLARATLGLREEDPVRQAPGSSAGGAFSVNTASTNNKCYWTKTLEYYTGYSVDDLKDTVLSIYEYQLHAEQLQCAPFNKFRNKAARFSVSTKTALRVEDLGFAPSAIRGVQHDTLQLKTE